MPRYTVDLEVTINISITVEAPDKEYAEDKWWSYSGALTEAKLAVANEARDLDDYEFDVMRVTNLENDKED